MLVFPALLAPKSTVRGARRMLPESFQGLKFFSRSFVSMGPLLSEELALAKARVLDSRSGGN